MTNEFQPWLSINTGQLNRIVVIVNKLKQLTSFLIQSLEYHFPVLNYVITFTLLAKVPRQLTGKQRSLSKLFSVFVHWLEKRPVALIRAFLKSNWVIVIGEEKLPELFKNRGWMCLEKMNWWIEDPLYNMDWVCDDNNFWNPW